MRDRIRDAYALGFGVWYDDLSRALLTSGELAQMVREGLVGVTSNPSIFEKAIDGSADTRATTLGYGPRFLHSTGQLHKGGRPTGVFLQITADDALDLAIPGRAYAFGTLARAQADGDLAVLAERRRRSMRVHLGGDLDAGLAALRHMVDEATRAS